jgi:hypothetical protein
MALVVYDRVKETTTTAGTGAITLLGASAGFQSFAVVGNTNTTYYCIAGQSTNEWEVGIGTYSTTGPSLARTTVLSSSNSGSATNFGAGTKDVFVVYPASKTVNSDLGTAANATNATSATAAGKVNNSLTAGTGVSYSSGTTYDGSAAITISIGQAVATSSNVQFNSLGVGTAGSTTAGEIRATNNVTAFYSSDAKFKENVQPITGASEIVRGIGADHFDWTADYIAEHGGEDGYFVRKEDFGVIAQKVQKVFPKAVRVKSDGTLAVDYEKLGVLAFPAIIEILDRLDAVEAKLE